MTRMEPTQHRTTEGSIFSFKCFTDILLVWDYNNGKLPQNAAVFRSNNSEFYRLEIRGVTYRKNHGKYSCYGIIGDYIVSKASGVLLVNGKFI